LKNKPEQAEGNYLPSKSFLDTHSKVMSTRVNVLAAIINIAKFIYKNETNTKLAKEI